jgi:6-phosphogluconolactonase/glucosamine-6-phosphate isomerase/deaminase
VLKAIPPIEVKNVIRGQFRGFKEEKGVVPTSKTETLTYPIINHSRRVLWVITRGEKATMFTRLREGDESIPAGRVSQAQAIVIADAEASRKNKE